VGVATALSVTIPTAVRNDDNIDDHEQRLVNDRPLEIVTGGQVPEDAGHQFLNVIVRRLAQQADEGVSAARRLDRSLVLVILAAVGQVPEITGEAEISTHVCSNFQQTFFLYVKSTLATYFIMVTRAEIFKRITNIRVVDPH
jgi:hypothetical protein